MADLTITPANVVAGSDATTCEGSAGVAVTAGQVVYFDGATSTFKLADNNSATAAARSPKGITLHAAGVGQPLAVQTKGSITIGATLTPGVAYYLGDVPGAICPVADLGTGEYPSIIGIATSATVLKLDFQESGVSL